MALYTIEWAKTKKEGNTNGRDWKIIDMTLKDESGTIIEDVSTFDPVTPGITIEGTIEIKDQYKNFKSTPKVSPQGNSGAFKGQQIAKAQETKAGYIAVAQDKTAHGVKVTSTMNKAIDLAIAEGKPTEDRILYWRQWIWEHWDAEETDFKPF